jgi:DNA processing protein
VAPLSTWTRPPPARLEAVVRALAMPGVGSGAMRRATHASRNADAELRALAARARSGLTSGERMRAEGWARRAMSTIQRGRIHVVTPDMPAYPAPFHHLASPPYAMFAAGRLELLSTPMIAIVGTRACTEYGRQMAGRLARDLADAGVTIVSGLALGIDGAAHRAAGADRTIAVLGCGLDVAYPPRHRPLQRDIGRRGLLLSEHLPGAVPAAFHFPRRNRMIAALGIGLVVVEAPAKSGALITARHALELGRPIFAVPGRLGAATSAGTNALIRDGAVLVTEAREILEALDLPVPPRNVDSDAPPSDLYGVGLALWSALDYEPRHVDDVAADLGLAPNHSLASLLALELQGHARQLPGMRFVRGSR